MGKNKSTFILFPLSSTNDTNLFAFGARWRRDHSPVIFILFMSLLSYVQGATGTGGRVLLQKVELPVYDLSDCQDVYGK